MAIPIASLNGSVTGEDATSSIKKTSPGSLLDPDDWRRAKAALADALDPQGRGVLVAWENPRSGLKGSFTALGKPYSSEKGICRVFFGEINRKGETESTQGTACSGTNGEWTIAEADPWRKS
jgi:surface antigen